MNRTEILNALRSGTNEFDVVVVGGGLMGSVTSWHLAKSGMKVAVVDKKGLGMGASGVNAGTLSIQGISTGPPVSSMTMVFRLAVATASISAS